MNSINSINDYRYQNDDWATWEFVAFGEGTCNGSKVIFGLTKIINRYPICSGKLLYTFLLITAKCRWRSTKFTSIGSRMVRGGGPRNMKYKGPPVAAIFFMTSFNRDRGGAMAPLAPPLDPQLFTYQKTALACPHLIYALTVADPGEGGQGGHGPTLHSKNRPKKDAAAYISCFLAPPLSKVSGSATVLWQTSSVFRLHHLQNGAHFRLWCRLYSHNTSRTHHIPGYSSSRYCSHWRRFLNLKATHCLEISDVESGDVSGFSEFCNNPVDSKSLVRCILNC